MADGKKTCGEKVLNMPESTATAETEKQLEEAFFKELDEYQLHMPGNRIVPFSDDLNLLDMVQRQYPGWKEKGRMTSVPPARVPKVFLESFQMHEKLQKMFKLTQKGDEGEIKLYRLFLDGSFAEEPGMIIFPNVDGSHIFKNLDTKDAKFEIDMVLVHLTIGIIVFNVKNQTKRGSSFQKVEKDIENHKGLIRMLLNYKNTAQSDNIPIHSVVCDFEKENSKFSTLEQENKDKDDKVVVFNKTDLKQGQFSDIWVSKISAAGIKNIVWTSSLDQLVARLIALASIEGDSALIHEQLRRGLMQSVLKEEYLEHQISTVIGANKNCKDAIVEHSQLLSIETKKQRKRFILWTKEQLKVIAKVYESLTRSADSYCRIAVTGGKGSGKTLLLCTLVKIVASVLEGATDNSSNSILVCEGTFKSIGLQAMLSEMFREAGITVSGKLPSVKQLQSIKVFFCDETTPQLFKYFLDNLRSDQHCILFSSDNRPQIEHRIELLRLSYCLRSTNQISHFANRFVERAPKNVILAFPSSKFEGEPVGVTFVSPKLDGQSSQKKSFLSDCTVAISVTANKVAGSGFIVVVPFVERKLLYELKRGLEAMEYACYDEPIPSVINSGPKSIQTTATGPMIFFCEPFKIEGCEFSHVMILIDPGVFETFTAYSYGSAILTAITRASLKVEIIVNNFGIPTEGDRKNYLIDIQNEKLREVLGDVSGSKNEKPRVLFVGKQPPALDFQKEIECKNYQLPAIEGIHLHKVEQGSLLHIDDIYAVSDFEKLLTFGVEKIFITNEEISCKWKYLFSIASVHCGRSFALQHPESLVFSYYVNNTSVMKFFYDLHLEFLQPGSKNSKPSLSGQEFWKDFESVMPVDEPVKWRIWKDKAAELYKIGEITTAITMYECSIKLLKRRIESISIADDSHFELVENDKIELSNLFGTLSMIYANHASAIQKGTRLHYNFENLHHEEGLMKAFRNAAKATKMRVNWQQRFQEMETIVSKVRNYSLTERFKTALSQLSSEDHFGLNTERFRLNSDIPLSNAEFNLKLQKLGSLISNYETKIAEENRSNLVQFRNNVSNFASSLSDESLKLIMETCDDKQEGDGKVQEQLDKIVQIFEYPVQLAMVAIHWDSPTKTNQICVGEGPQVLNQAVDALEDAIRLFKEITSSKEH